MSYVLSPYLIEIEKLRSAVGSGDRKLVESIVAGGPDVFASEPADGEISLKDALSQLVAGKPEDNNSTHQYGYALEHLCRQFGKRLDSGVWDAVRWEALEATGMEDIVEKTGPPVPLPRIRDFPGIGHVPLGKLDAALEQIRAKCSEQDDEDIQELCKQAIEWFEEAIQQKKTVVFFYY